MDNIFLFKLLTSFFIGGLWVISATIIADKYGSKLGGLIAGLPSTLLFGLFFIAWTQNTEAAVKATTIVPIIGGINCLFLCSYVYFLRKNIWFSLLTSILLWSLISFFLILFKFNNFLISIFGYILFFVFSYVFFEKILKIKSVKSKKIKYSFSMILFRGLLSGLLVSISVLLAKIGGPIFGGMFSMFPAMFSSTIMVTYFSQGPEFSSAIAKSIMISSISIVIYSLAVRFSYFNLGIVFGTLFSILTSSLSGYLIYKLVVKKSI